MQIDKIIMDGKEISLGGGVENSTYKLIQDIVLEEAVTEFYVNKDLDGNVFELTDIVILVDFQVSTGGTSACLWGRFGDGSVGDQAQYKYAIPTNGKTNNYLRYVVIMIEKVSDTWYKIFTSQQSSSPVGETITAGCNSLISTSVSVLDKIREFKLLLQGTDITMPVGTTIKVYGK